MRHGQLDRLGAGDERRAARASGASRTQRDSKWPESLWVRVAAAGGRAAGQEPGLDQDLEAVADPQDQAAAVVEPAQGVAQDRPEPGGEDPPGPEVVAVGEAAGDGQDLEVVERAGRLEEPADVPGLDRRPPRVPRRPTVSSSQLVPGAAGRSRGAVPWSSLGPSCQ